MDFHAHIKNFGPVPETNYLATWKIFVNGVQQQPHTITGSPMFSKRSTIFPTQVGSLFGSSGTQGYSDLKNGAILVVEVTVEYSGPTGDYKECRREIYSVEEVGFLDLGPTCSE